MEECFHISKACIEPTLNNGKVCSVYLEQDNEEFILCNLSQKNLNESLDLNFTEGEKICFRVEVRKSNQTNVQVSPLSYITLMQLYEKILNSIYSN